MILILHNTISCFPNVTGVSLIFDGCKREIFIKKSKILPHFGQHGSKSRLGSLASRTENETYWQPRTQCFEDGGRIKVRSSRLVENKHGRTLFGRLVIEKLLFICRIMIDSHRFRLEFDIWPIVTE